MPKYFLSLLFFLVSIIGYTISKSYAQEANFGIGAAGGIPWYQTENGDVYAQNPVTVNISATLPANVYLSLRQNAANPPYPGVITQGSDTKGSFGGGGPSQPGWYAMKSPYGGVRFDYTYFSSKFTANETMPACIGGPINFADVESGKILCYQGGATLSGPIAMPSGSASIVFVDGDLTIDKKVSVTTGGFVVFIVKGTITVDSTLGQAVPSANPTIPDIQGMFIANQFISTSDPTVQTQLVIKGTVVGWNGIQLNRVLSDNTIPAEYFIFDPALMRFAPASLMKSTILWQQVPA